MKKKPEDLEIAFTTTVKQGRAEFGAIRYDAEVTGTVQTETGPLSFVRVVGYCRLEAGPDGIAMKVAKVKRELATEIAKFLKDSE